VATAIAGVIGAPVVRPEEFDVGTAGDYDLIGLGSGIYHGKHHKNLTALAEKLPNSDKSVFIFSTAGKGDINQHKYLGLIIANKGYRNAGEFICKGWDTWGPFKFIGGINRGLPNEAMLEQARDFAKTLEV
jgi:flavodoxin